MRIIFGQQTEARLAPRQGLRRIREVKEDQGEMFPKSKKSSKLDLKELGDRIMARKE